MTLSLWSSKSHIWQALTYQSLRPCTLAIAATIWLLDVTGVYYADYPQCMIMMVSCVHNSAFASPQSFWYRFTAHQPLPNSSISTILQMEKITDNNEISTQWACLILEPLLWNKLEMLNDRPRNQVTPLPIRFFFFLEGTLMGNIRSIHWTMRLCVGCYTMALLPLWLWCNVAEL